MPTVHQARGLRFIIFVNDHDPAHVHVIGGRAEAKIDLGADTGTVGLVRVVGLTNAQTRFALSEATRERDKLIAAWMRIHGGSRA